MKPRLRLLGWMEALRMFSFERGCFLDLNNFFPPPLTPTSTQESCSLSVVDGAHGQACLVLPFTTARTAVLGLLVACLPRLPVPTSLSVTFLLL